MKNDTQQSGFALLIGVLVSAVMISIAFIMFSITLKQIELTTTARESQTAIYAADAGLECALYWDLVGGSDETSQFATSTAGQIKCLGQTITTGSGMTVEGDSFLIGGGGDAQATSTFQISYNTDDMGNYPYCAIVQVGKVQVGDSVATTIVSRGYNTCITSNPARVERAFRIDIR